MCAFSKTALPLTPLIGCRPFHSAPFFPLPKTHRPTSPSSPHVIMTVDLHSTSHDLQAVHTALWNILACADSAMNLQPLFNYFIDVASAVT